VIYPYLFFVLKRTFQTFQCVAHNFFCFVAFIDGNANLCKNVETSFFFHARTELFFSFKTCWWLNMVVVWLVAVAAFAATTAATSSS